MSISGNSGARPSPAAGRLAASSLVSSRRGIAAARSIEFKPRKAPYVPAKAVGSFVPGLTRKSFEKFGFATAQLITDWADVAGADVARYTVPERIRWPRLPMGAPDDADGGGRGGATLILRVDPARALDVEYKRAQLMERINVYFGYRAVADVRIVQGTVDAGSGQTGRVATANAGRGTPPINATPAKPAPAAGVDLKAIDDGSLRQALERMQASILGRTTR